MIFFWSHIMTAGLVLAVISCASSPKESRAAAIRPSSDEVPGKPKKMPRMNGRGKISSISLTDAFALQQSGKVLLYDARPPFFYSLGHIPGAISLPKSHCDKEIDKREVEIKAAIAAKKPIVIYCTNLLCPDARTVALHFADRGYSSSTLTGGWEAWKDSGLPTE